MRTNNRMKLLLLGLIVIALISVISSMTQTLNDPFESEDANACAAGGSMAGTCESRDTDVDGDVDQNDIDWMWRCGWYMIRVEYGIYDASILEGICMDITPEVIVEEKKEEKKKDKEVVVEEEEVQECSECPD